MNKEKFKEFIEFLSDDLTYHCEINKCPFTEYAYTWYDKDGSWVGRPFCPCTPEEPDCDRNKFMCWVFFSLEKTGQEDWILDLNN